MEVGSMMNMLATYCKSQWMVSNHVSGAVGGGRGTPNVDITWPFNDWLYGGFYNLMIKRQSDVNPTELEKSESPLSGLQLTANLARLFQPVLAAREKSNSFTT